VLVNILWPKIIIILAMCILSTICGTIIDVFTTMGVSEASVAVMTIAPKLIGGIGGIILGGFLILSIIKDLDKYDVIKKIKSIWR
jgi:hypothetical protein